MKVEELLEDAHLVASFGQRSGLLKSSDLFKAIQQAEEEKATLSWASPAAMQLQSAVNAAIPDIAPISLLNLREGFNPYNPVKKHAKRLRLTLIGSALLLLSVGAHFSIWQEGATDVLAEIAKNKFVIQQAIVDSLLPTVAELDKAGANFGELEDTNSLARSAFRAEVAEAQRLAREMVDDNRRFTKIDSQFLPLWYPVANFVTASGFFSTATSAATASQTRNAPAATGKPTEDLPALLANLGPYKHCFRRKTADFSTTVTLASGMSDYPGVYLFGTLVERDQSLMQRVRCLVGLELIERQINNSALDRSRMEDRLDLLNIFLLPAFYGMLGAIIYHLRICLEPMRPDPDWVRVVLRIFLGGFAGVSVAWFFRPDAASANPFADITLGALATAFLVGFSIDVFFTLLDRLVTWMNQAASTVGAAKQV